MGGYDLFKSQLSKNGDKWSTPLNLGYPLNNTLDNMNISFSAHWSNETETTRNKYAYVAAYREEGFGDLDIYRVTFNSVEPLLTTITGTITITITITDTASTSTQGARAKEPEVWIFGSRNLGNALGWRASIKGSLTR